jgi:hypothetical protein
LSSTTAARACPSLCISSRYRECNSHALLFVSLLLYFSFLKKLLMRVHFHK